jgi:hypothetical protein
MLRPTDSLLEDEPALSDIFAQLYVPGEAVDPPDAEDELGFRVLLEQPEILLGSSAPTE